jgi:uncharacterized Zn-finger protein
VLILRIWYALLRFADWGMCHEWWINYGDTARVCDGASLRNMNSHPRVAH